MGVRAVVDTAESGHGVTSAAGPRPAVPRSPQVIAKANLLSGQATAQEGPSQALIP